MEISLLVTIQEMHAKDVTVYFGFLLYDASVITVGFYEGQRLIPDTIPDGYIYGISLITAQNTTSGRRLQLIPNLPSAPATLSPRVTVPTPKMPLINAINPVNIYPTIVQLNSTQSSSASSTTITNSSYPAAAAAKRVVSPAIQPQAYIPPRQSSTAQVLRSGANQVILTPKSVDSTLFSAVMQSDGIIDANPTALSTLQQLGVVPYSYQKA
jgi:hypothetical protein